MSASKGWAALCGVAWLVTGICSGAAWVTGFRGIAVTFLAAAILCGVQAWRLWPRESWRVVESGWPYPDGYATYHPASKTILDTGISREEAERRVRELNLHAQRRRR